MLQRSSTPKLVLWNNALVTALAGMSFREARADGGWWGRLVENAFGAGVRGAFRSDRLPTPTPPGHAPVNAPGAGDQTSTRYAPSGCAARRSACVSRAGSGAPV